MIESDKEREDIISKEYLLNIYNLLKRTEKQFNKIERQIIQEKPHFDKRKVTPPQWFVLRILWKQDGLPLKYLATAAKCSRSTITGIIDTMEKNSLVKRLSNPDDGRSTLVVLTDSGKELGHYGPSFDSYLTENCKNFSREELQMLILLLKKFLKSLEL
ncbi:MAG: MarR family transcriptional regulator [Candidatus Lokiarchaeota archaeon]|nr:MarR family transcriptional regulator [Candidatus Lokiarchaeota archaeon]